LPDDPEGWLAEEARLDQRVLAMIPPEQRDELILLMEGDVIAGVSVDLDKAETRLDAALLTRLTAAQREELELIMQGKYTDGVPVDLDALEADLDRNVAP
jgi:hypothetical protein